MPEYYYEAYLSNGKVDSNTITASNERAAHSALSSSGKLPYVLRPLADNRFGNALGKTPRGKPGGKIDWQRLFVDISVLLKSGFTIDQTLSAIISDTGKSNRRQHYQQILDRLKEGSSVADAFSLSGVSKDVAALISAGENSGKLPDVFDAIAKRFEERAKRKSEITEALLYPAFLIVMMIVTVSILAFYLVPAIEPIFEAGNADKPMIIAVLSLLRNQVVDNIFWILPGCLALLVTAVLSRGFRLLLARPVYAFPLVGRFLIDSSIASYLRMLELLLANGITAKEAMAMASDAAQSHVAKTRLEKAGDAVVSGSSLHRAFDETQLFNEGVVTHIRLGEESNNLPAMLDRSASLIEARQKALIDRVMKFLTPAITIGLGLMIGTLVISVMSTLLSINELAIR